MHPRSPKNQVLFSTLTHTESKDSPIDFYQFLAFAFGMFGFIMRQVWSSLAGVLMLICSCKFSSFDYSQLILNGADDRDESSYYFMFFRSPFDQPA
jgi:hypothetical protein